MFEDLNDKLDQLLAGCGLTKVADETGQLPSDTQNVQRDAAGAEGPDAARKPKQGKTPIGMLTGNVPKSFMPEGMGRLEGNGNAVTVVGRGFGGMDVTAAMKSVRSLAKIKSATKLGFRKLSQTLLAFGPSNDMNREKVLGFAYAALRFKYADARPEYLAEKLESDPLVKEIMKLSTLGPMGAPTQSAVTGMLGSLLAPVAVGGSLLLGYPIGPKKNDLLTHGNITYKADQWLTPKDV